MLIKRGQWSFVSMQVPRTFLLEEETHENASIAFNDRPRGISAAWGSGAKQGRGSVSQQETGESFGQSRQRRQDLNGRQRQQDLDGQQSGSVERCRRRSRKGEGARGYRPESNPNRVR